MTDVRAPTRAPPRGPTGGSPERLSDELERWLQGDTEKTLGSLIELFGERSFAILFVLLLGVPALPLPTGGATHVFEVMAMLLALQLIAGRDEVWLPRRWRQLAFSGLDTLPALGVVLLSLGVLLEDFAVAIAGIAVAAAGVVLEIAIGSAAVNALVRLF